MASPERRRGAFLGRYAANAEARPHGQFERSAVICRGCRALRTRPTRMCWVLVGGGRFVGPDLQHGPGAGGTGVGPSAGERAGLRARRQFVGSLIRNFGRKFRAINAAMCGAAAGCAASVAQWSNKRRLRARPGFEPRAATSLGFHEIPLYGPPPTGGYGVKVNLLY